MKRKLKLLLWKNYLFRRRRWCTTIFLAIAPTLLMSSLNSIAESPATNKISQPALIYEPLRQDELKNEFVTELGKDSLLYAPSINGTDFASLIMEKLEIKTNSAIMGFENEEALFTYYSNLNITDSRNVYAVIFEDPPSDGSVPKQFKYKIRIASNISQETTKLFSTGDEIFPTKEAGTPDIYRSTRFAGLQFLLDEIYMEMSNVQVPDIQVQKFPYLVHISDELCHQNANRFSLASLSVSGLIFLTSLGALLDEKDSGTKELMKMNGINTWMLWLVWCIDAMVFATIGITIGAISFKVSLSAEPALLSNSNLLLVWLFLMLYFSAAATFSIAMSCVFSNSLLATTLMMVLWIVPYFIGAIVHMLKMSAGVKYFLTLIPNCAINFGSEILFSNEYQGDGIHWNNLFEGNEALGPILIILVVDCVIYILISWYLEAIMPGKYGAAKPAHFIFMPSFWRSRKVSSAESQCADISKITAYEPPSENLKAGIRIRKLYKVYHNSSGRNAKIAVDRISLDMYYGEITALLGHNGAGKTTVMSILTGTVSPSSGTVHINDYDVATDIKKVRDNLGYCPQENLFCAHLTVLEHLRLFAAMNLDADLVLWYRYMVLRGFLSGFYSIRFDKASLLDLHLFPLLTVPDVVNINTMVSSSFKEYSKKKDRKNAKNMLKRLKLTADKNKLVSALSGGLKRRLSLGIALVGNSNVIILDEPTSGMDIEARRRVWDLLLSMRDERIILISTHLMEEADILGDRIAIMADGRVHCYATSLFLKKYYGLGFQLTLLKQENCDESEVTKTLQAAIPDVVLKNETIYILNYSLPYDKTDKFPELFDSLERQKSTLGITSISMSIMTLDEVFLKVGEERKREQGDPGEGEKITENIESNQGNLDAFWSADAKEALKRMQYSSYVAFLRAFNRNSCETVSTIFRNIPDPDHATAIVWTPAMGEILRKFSALPYVKLRGVSLFFEQMRVMLVKKIILSRGIFCLLIIQAMFLFMYTTFIIAAVSAIGRLVQNLTSPLELKLTDYGKTVAVYSGNNSKQYIEQYVETLKMTGSEPKKAENVIDSLISVGEHDHNTYFKKYIVAADFGSNITALYSTAAYHSLPISFNMIVNSILRPQGSTVAVTNHPLNAHEEMRATYWFQGISFIFIAHALMSIAAIFIIVPNAEHVNKAKQLQYMSGVSPLMYWISYFLWDVLLYMTIIVVMLILVLAFDMMKYFSGLKEIGTLMLICALYGCSAIPAAYFYSCVYETRTQAVSAYEIESTIYGIAIPLIIYFVSNGEKTPSVPRWVLCILDLSPHFALTQTLVHFSIQAVWNNQCKSVSCKEYNMGFCCYVFKKDPSRYVKPYLEFASKDNPNGLLDETLFLAFDGFVSFSMLAFVEYNLWAKTREAVLRIRFGTDVETTQELDDDVTEEQKHVLQALQGRVSAPNDRNDILLVGDLVKRYKGRFPAVKSVSFGVIKGECFGLLGSNGAGKTTIFKMLTGDTIPTRGDATLVNYTLRKHTKKFLRQIGYCPQFDAHNELMTGRQILQLYAGLCGIPRKHARQEVNKWISLIGLHQYEKEKSGTYSGGTKRKLGTAVALIVNPTILFLDEPTSGIDPISRRNLWNIFDKKQNSGQSIVLTSHSMDECEALCGRLAIMVAGEFVCLGPIPHLKQKFTQGFTIQIKLNVISDYGNEVKELKKIFEQQPLFLDNCELLDEHLGLLHYNIKNPDILWSQLFKTMEDMKTNHDIIQDYIVAETSLEQVFLYFAKQETAKGT